MVYQEEVFSDYCCSSKGFGDYDEKIAKKNASETLELLKNDDFTVLESRATTARRLLICVSFIYSLIR